MAVHSGPLAGVEIVEINGIGPAPYAAMLLADLCTAVLRNKRKEGNKVMNILGLGLR
jgi:alpha-methylacyl-CoA racemase